MAESTLLGKTMEPRTPASGDEKTLGLLAHVITLVSTIIAPLIIYLLKKDSSEFVANHAKESLNFQITVILLGIAFSLLTLVIIGIFLLPLLGAADVILVIVATMHASEGRLYRYPFCLRLIK